ncbi:phosphatase PAP2 family protein [Oceanospirillum maris]|uniref:phosphatase PAP2 family protein n=1 Tax=Oceanospirillum maris TaxID=64977 RepID=UPI0003FB79C6|nr:phosphatase PAP2 family protein [Oceanospirillum maris]
MKLRFFNTSWMLGNWMFGSFLFFVLLFSLWPELDIQVSRLFFDPETGRFPANDNLVVKFVYWLFKVMPTVIVPLLLGLCGISLLKKCPRTCRKNRLNYAFMLIFLLLGPGLIVHTGFKDNWDRARPRNVVEFGGNHQFTPPLVVSDQCDKNCSFTSGHAAMGFAFIALAWVLQSRLWLVIGLGLGLFVGGVRVIQGGHFLSDIIFAGYICYGTAWLLGRWILKRPELALSKKDTS